MANPIRDLVIKVSVDADISGFEQLDDAQEKTGAGTVAMGNLIANATTALVEYAAQAVKAGAALVTDLVFGTTEAADALAKNAKQLGVQAEGLQRLSGAAQLSGADVATLDKGVRVLTKGLADANRTGTGPAAEALASLGLTVDDLAGDLASGDIEDVVGTIGDAFNETGDSIEKSAALMQLFGGAGTKLRPLLEEGSEGVEALGDQIKNVIADEDLEQFEALADAQFLVDDATQNLENQLAAGLAPAVQTVFERIGTFIDENEELIEQDLPAFLAASGEALVDLADFTFEVIESWREFITEIDNAAERFEMDFPAATGIAADALAVVGQVADDVTEKVDELVNFILNAVSKLEGLEDTVAGIKAGLGLDDDDTTTTRGGAAFLGGGEALEGSGLVTSASVPASKLTPDNSSESLQQIVDSNSGTESDRALARASLPAAKFREVTERAESLAKGTTAEEDKAAAAAARKAARAKARAAAAAAAANGGGGGGGRGRGRAAAAPTVDELIAGAVGVASGGPSRVGGGAALSGTNLININQSTNITNGPVTLTIEVPQSIADSGSAEQLGAFFRREYVAMRDAENRVDFDRAAARGNVGGG